MSFLEKQCGNLRGQWMSGMTTARLSATSFDCLLASPVGMPLSALSLFRILAYRSIPLGVELKLGLGVTGPSKSTRLVPTAA